MSCKRLGGWDQRRFVLMRMQRRSAHVVTFRNNLNKIMNCPYNRRDGFAMGVLRDKGCLTLDVRHSHESVVHGRA